MCSCHLSKENYSIWEDDSVTEALVMKAGGPLSLNSQNQGDVEYSSNAPPLWQTGGSDGRFHGSSLT